MIKYFLCLLGLATALPLTAEPAATNTPATNQWAAIPDASHPPVGITNTVTIAGERVTYAAETGMLPILKTDGTLARVGFLRGVHPAGTPPTPRSRPVTFCFNGGPGSASVWLHLGALGPRRAQNEPRRLAAARRRLRWWTTNIPSLNASDLVFIDPVATGFSRAAKEAKADRFFRRLARIWIPSANSSGCGPRGTGAGSSPKYLCGESYGVFRAAGLADHLRGRYGIYLNGLILVSGVLDFATISGGTRQRPAVSADLPAYTAAAHFHKKLPADLQADLDKALAESRAFARGEYARRCRPARNCRRRSGKKW